MIVAAFAAICGLTLAAPAFADDSAAEPEPIEIQADHFEMLMAERRTTYTGNVVATQGQRTIKSRKLVVQFNDDNDITTLRAAGEPARLTDRTGDSAFSVAGEALDYNFDAGTVRAAGDSVLSRNGDTLAAETILYDMDAKTARAVGTETRPVFLRLAPMEAARR